MTGPRHNRREFLRGKAALAAAADAAQGLIDVALGPPGLSPAASGRAPHLLRLSRRAMACEFEVTLNETPDRDATEHGLAALDVVERVEDQLTVYRAQSELQRVNRLAAGAPVEVEPGLFGLLAMCGRVHDDSDGAFDPTSGPLSRVWGFHRRSGRVPCEADLAAALGLVGWRHVRLDPQHRTVQFLREGMDLHCNSSGKGYALDVAGRMLDARGVPDSLMHGGRSTLLARGSSALEPRGGWVAGLRDPLDPSRRLAEVVLRGEALSTSGSGTQYFEHAGRRYGHLIDPRTGWPAEGLYSATVIAPTAAEADALSTAAYVLGVEGTARLVERRPGLKALLLAPDEGGGVRVHPFGLADEDWRPATA